MILAWRGYAHVFIFREQAPCPEQIRTRPSPCSTFTGMCMSQNEMKEIKLSTKALIHDFRMFGPQSDM